MKLLVTSIGLLLAHALCFGSNITYDVDQTAGAGTVTGFIVTDGATGVLGTSDILDWNLLLNDGFTTFDLFGPLSGSNSQVGVSGSDLSATATALSFNFSGDGYAIFQAPTLFTGSKFWCNQGGSVVCSAYAASGEVINTAAANQVSAISGTRALGSVNSVPEPSTFVASLVCFFWMTTVFIWRKRAKRRSA